MRLSLLVCVLRCCGCFCPQKRQPPRPAVGSKTRDYSDDAFGLVLLGSLAILRDYDFAASFLALSLAAAGTNAAQPVDLLPGAVAPAALALTPLLAATHGVDHGQEPLELALCGVSVLAALLKYSRTSHER
mmetsp:Transcript_5691/g.18564  ORF Transcript_5691/g.18564 Transcript_5691/m.18564 type:complete len:131 (+) Transcript_5691:31-423(+)